MTGGANTPASGKAVTKGYIKFFDPDVYVEAEEGLLEKSDLAAFREDLFDSKVVSLDNFFESEYGGRCEPSFGLSAHELLTEVYDTERRFKLRDDFPAIYSASESAMSEACIGSYPIEDQIGYIKDAYYNVFRPSDCKFDPDLWKKIYGGHCETPFSVTRRHYEVRSSWNDEPILFVFNPSSTKDLIDFWNLRTLPAPVYPVPLNWLPQLADSLRKFISSHYRPLRGNKHGVMHRVTIEIAGSISDEKARDFVLPHFAELEKGSYSFKEWQTSIWDVNYHDDFIYHPKQAMISADGSDQVIELKDDSNSGTFYNLAPKFAKKYSGSQCRWANVVLILGGFEGSQFALSLPFNTFDRSWPYSHFGQFACGREGWVFLNEFMPKKQHVEIMKNEDAFISWFKLRGIDSRLSDAGRIAKQMFDSLGGFWGLYLIDDKCAIQFINKHASSTRRRSSQNSGEFVEEDFRGGSAGIEEWENMIRDRARAGSHSMVGMQNYIESNVAKIGLESECNYCQTQNWHSLDDTSYELRCLRCLKTYDFPQGKLKKFNGNWRYRVIGPFSVPDFAQGAYTSLLTIRFITQGNRSFVQSSFSTALDLEINGRKTEIDFAIFLPKEKGFDVNGEPRLIIGECKSFGCNAVKDSDLEGLKLSAGTLEDTIIVISVLKDSFSPDEVERLKEFVQWARQPINHRPRHWVVLLTGIELFNHRIESAWKDRGEPYSKYANHQTASSLERLSDATQAIHLGLASYHSCQNSN